MFTCTLCNRSFKTMFSMERHLNCNYHYKNYEKLDSDNIIIFDKYIEQIRKENSSFKKKETFIKKTKFICKCCDKSYLNEKCFLKHTESLKHKVKENPTNKDKIVQKSNESSDKRIPVINRKTMIIKYGKNAPMKSKLSHFLVNNPDYDIHMGYTIDKTLLINIKDKLLDIVKFIEEEIKK